MTNPKISFIVPVFNFENYISKCIESIVNQNCDEIEVLIIDDGSTDATGDVCDALAKNDHRIKVVHKQNNGVSAARNTGLEIARGEYVVFVDGDDYLARDFSDYMLQLVLRSNSDFGVSLNCFCNKNEEQIREDHTRVIQSEEAVGLLLSPRVIVGSWNKIYKRSMLVKNNLKFSEDLFYGEGLRFIVQVAKYAATVAVGERKVYYYRRNNFDSATSKFNIKNFYNGWKALEMIDGDLSDRSASVDIILKWHKTQFKMGAVIRILESKRKSEHKDFYSECLKYVRKHTWSTLFDNRVSLYKKALLIGCCICPHIMAHMDILRRKEISKKSV